MHQLLRTPAANNQCQCPSPHSIPMPHVKSLSGGHSSMSLCWRPRPCALNARARRMTKAHPPPNNDHSVGSPRPEQWRGQNNGMSGAAFQASHQHLQSPHLRRYPSAAQKTRISLLQCPCQPVAVPYTTSLHLLPPFNNVSEGQQARPGPCHCHCGSKATHGMPTGWSFDNGSGVEHGPTLMHILHTKALES
jgi:hypothetical protein